MANTIVTFFKRSVAFKRYSTRHLPIWTRRAFRLPVAIALSLFIGYGLNITLPYLAPLFAFFLGLKPGKPMAVKGLVGLILLTFITLSFGLFIIPILIHYPAVAILLVSLGLFISNVLTINKGKVLVGTFLTVGFTMISLAGSVNFALAITIIQSLVLAITIAVICHWLVYPFFPENKQATKGDELPTQTHQSKWLALRSMLIVLPAYCFALTNPLAYMPIMLKSVALSQQANDIKLRIAAKELIGSTLLAGLFAILFWLLLDLVTELWAFATWMLLFSLYIIAKLYQINKSNFSPSFWQNVFVTMLILLGPSVEDSVNGKDVYTAFAIRFGLFCAVSIYSILAIYCLEHLKNKQ